MRKFFLFFLLLFTFLSSTRIVFAQETSQKSYFKGEVVGIIKEQKSEAIQMIEQTIDIRISEGIDKGKVFRIHHSFQEKLQDASRLHKGDRVLLTKLQDGKTTRFAIFDRYRLDNLVPFFVGFIALVLLMTRKKGAGALLGLCLSFLTIILFIVPQILAGHDPLLVSIAGCVFILITTLYLAHGISQQTTVAVISTSISLIITGFLAVLLVQVLQLHGIGDENAYMLQLGGHAINLRGLLLGGIMLGALGVLDDTTTTQAATVFALAHTNHRLTLVQLLQKGMLIGREHIASLVNTLVLAYAGVSLPLFIFFVINPMHLPWWVILNNEMIVEEVVRTLAGSIGLILAVPITTLLAAFLSRYSLKIT